MNLVTRLKNLWKYIITRPCFDTLEIEVLDRTYQQRFTEDEWRITQIERKQKEMAEKVVTKEEFKAELGTFVGEVKAYTVATNNLIAAIQNPTVTDYSDLMQIVKDAEPDVATLPSLPPTPTNGDDAGVIPQNVDVSTDQTNA